MNILIRHIRGLVQVREEVPSVISGRSMGELPVLTDAWLSIRDGWIAGFGPMQSLPQSEVESAGEVIDASGKFVFPSWCDSHTHLVFAGSREQEFADRISGLTYEEIAARGGGILNSVQRLASTTEDELYAAAYERLNEMMFLGTGAVEIKSGYGLDLENELKMLRVIRRLGEHHPLTIRATFLGAHAVPLAFKGNREGYVDYLLREILPAVKSEGLADFIDVFCEKNYFTVEDTERILEAGAAHGLEGKVHVNQFNVLGGVAACVKHRARSVDHLEWVSDEDIEALKGAVTLPVALPGCSLFIGIPYTPARRIIDAGLPLALATDYNPGSAPSGNMNLVMSLGCIQMKMTPEEVFNAATINGAYAMNVHHALGHIRLGAKANVFISREMNSLAHVPYSFGSNPVETVILNGKVMHAPPKN